MDSRGDDEPTALTYLVCLAQIGFVTASYWLVGLLPEENHSKKGNAWARMSAYRWAAWHFRKYLKYSDDSFGRASLGWCYANLGMIDSAVQHYRLAYNRSKNADLACGLAQVELSAGNTVNARRLLAEISTRRHELSPEFVTVFGELETLVLTAVDPGEPSPDHVSLDPGPIFPSNQEKGLVSALVKAYKVFVITFVVSYVIPALWGSSTPAQLIESVPIALLNGFVFVAGVLVVHAPLLALMRPWLGHRLTRTHAGILGAALAPGPIVIYLAVLAGISPEPTGLWDLIGLMFLRPMDLLGLVPFVFGAIAFAPEFMKTNDHLGGLS